MAGYPEMSLVRGLRYLAESQAAIAHNLANVDTAGFKRRAPVAVESRLSFDTMLGQKLPLVNYSESTDFQVGTPRETGNKFDVALGEGTWFRVADDKGRAWFTRDGQMQLDVEGNLVTHGGLRYLDQSGSPIRVGDGDSPPADLVVSPNGQIADPTSGQTFGPLGVFKVADQQALIPQGAGLYTDTKNQQLELAANGVQQGYREGSNVDSLQELVQMILVQRGFSATERALTTVGRMQDQLIANVSR